MARMEKSQSADELVEKLVAVNRTAKVVKASSSCDGDPLEVGSLVYVLPKSGHKMQADGEDYLLVKSEDIVAVQL